MIGGYVSFDIITIHLLYSATRELASCLWKTHTYFKIHFQSFYTQELTALLDINV
jgi:hypothetical protein